MPSVCVCGCLRVLPQSEALMRHVAVSAPIRSYSMLQIHRAAIGCLLFLYSKLAAQTPSFEMWSSDGH